MKMSLPRCAASISKNRKRRLLSSLPLLSAVLATACGLPPLPDAQHPDTGPVYPDPGLPHPNNGHFDERCFDNTIDGGPTLVDPWETGHFRPDSGPVFFDAGCAFDAGPTDPYVVCDGGYDILDSDAGTYVCRHAPNPEPDACDGGRLFIDVHSGAIYCQPHPQYPDCDGGWLSVDGDGGEPTCQPYPNYPDCDGGWLFYPGEDGGDPTCGSYPNFPQCDGGDLFIDENAQFFCRPPPQYPECDGGYLYLDDDGGITCWSHDGGFTVSTWDAGPPRLDDGGLPNRGYPVLRGCSGCGAPRPTCEASSAYLVSVSCHADADGGWYAVNPIAGNFCHALPEACASHPTCECLSQFGAFRPGSTTPCPGNYWSCIEGSGDRPAELRCTPP